jgi:Leucine Rich repeat
MLKELQLGGCFIGDKGISLIVDVLVGKTSMDALNIRNNAISPRGLGDITRLID